MNLGEIATKGRDLVKANATSYPNDKVLVNLNLWLDKITTMILDSQDESDYDDSRYSDFPIKFTNLVENQPAYEFPSRMLAVKRLETKLDGTNWRKAEPLDINEIGGSTDTATIADNFFTDKPYYDAQYGFIFLYPIPQQDVDSGMKIWVSRSVRPYTSAELSTGTVEPGFDREFTPILAYGIAYEKAVEDQLPVQETLKRQLDEYEQRLRRHYGSKQKDRNYSLTSAYVDYN